MGIFNINPREWVHRPASKTTRVNADPAPPTSSRLNQAEPHKDGDERTRQLARGLEIRDQMMARQPGDPPSTMPPRDPRIVRAHIEYVNRCAWGELWVRPGLSLAMRSAVTIMALIALDRPLELAVHIKAGLRNGLTVEEISEILLHATGYCGFPAGNMALRVAEPILSAYLDDHERETRQP